jgi:ABC-type glycerol-3-phosphate transport system substrate-binding protein
MVLAACGATPTPTPTGTAVDKVTISAPVEVVFWHVSSQTQGENLQKMVDEFNSKNPNIKVKAEYKGSYSDIRKAILAAITAGITPDVAVAYTNQVAEYANAGKIVVLDDYINSSKYGLSKADLDDLYAAYLAVDRNPTQGNKLLSMRTSPSMEVMFYNISMMKELGLGENPPKTWDDFARMCKAAGKAGKKGYALSVSASTLAGWIFTRGGEILSADGKKALLTEKPAVDSLVFLKELIDDGCAYQIAERYGDQTDFANGKVLFTFGSTAGLPYYRDAIQDKAANKQKFDWSVDIFPNTGKPVVDMYGPSWTIFKSTPEKQLASWLFVKWFTETEQTAKWSVLTGYFPMRKSAANSEAVKKQMESLPVYKKSFDFLPYAKSEPNVSAWEAIRAAMADAITAVATGKMTPQAALEEANKKANEALAQ